MTYGYDEPFYIHLLFISSDQVVMAFLWGVTLSRIVTQFYRIDGLLAVGKNVSAEI